MIVAISAAANQVFAPVVPSFEEAAYYLIFDLTKPVNADYKAVHNPSVQSVNNVGILAAQMLVNLGVEVLITGWCDPNALRVFQKARIPLYRVTAGTVLATVRAFKDQNFSLEELLKDEENGSAKFL